VSTYWLSQLKAFLSDTKHYVLESKASKIKNRSDVCIDPWFAGIGRIFEYGKLRT